MQGGTADKLFIPDTAEDVTQILRDANENKIPVTISGARTGTVGGAIPFGGYVISLEKLNKIKSIDKEAKTAVVEPGVILADLQKAVEAEGLFYPPSGSWKRNGAVRLAARLRQMRFGSTEFLKYGATREFVRRLTVSFCRVGISRIFDAVRMLSVDGLLSFTTRSGRTHNDKGSDLRTSECPKERQRLFQCRAARCDRSVYWQRRHAGRGHGASSFPLLPKPEGFFSGMRVFLRMGV